MVITKSDMTSSQPELLPLASPIVPRGRDSWRGWEVTHDDRRDELVRKGLEAMKGVSPPSPSRRAQRTPEQQREIEVSDHVRNTLEGYDRCRKSVYYQSYEHKDEGGRRSHGNSHQPLVDSPCNAPGHETCGAFHLGRETEKWSRALRRAYPDGFVVVAFKADGLGPAMWGKAVNRFRRRKAGETVSAETAGVPLPTHLGFAYVILVPKDRCWMLPLASSCWEDVVSKLGGGAATVQKLEVAGDVEAIEVFVELRARAEQAPPILVGMGLLSPEAGLEILRARYNKPRIVFGRGFKRLRDMPSVPDADPMSDVQSPEQSPSSSTADHGEIAASPVPASALNMSGCPEPSHNHALAGGGGSGIGLAQGFSEGPPPPDDSRAEPPTTEETDEEWVPCRACDKPGCLQRPVPGSQPIHWIAFRKMSRNNSVLMLPGKNGTFIEVPPPLLNWMEK